MPKFLNTQLFTFHNLIVIGGLAILAHFTLIPVYSAVMNGKAQDE